MFMKRMLMLLLTIEVLLSCSGGSYSHLQEIESYMENEPKRALEELRQIFVWNVQIIRK